jgi:hypothetical protein
MRGLFSLFSLPGRFASLSLSGIVPALLLVTADAARAQNATPPSPVQPVAPAVPAAPPSGAAGDDDATDWRFVTRLSAVATYDDNIFIQPANPQDDYLFRVAPSLGFGIGSFRSEFAPLSPTPHFLARTGEEDLPRKDFAFVGYTPEGVFFADHRDENALNHDARLAARREEELWNLQGELRFQSIEDTDIDVGRRLRQTYYTASAAGEHALTGKVTGGAKVLGYRSEYATGFSSTDMRGTAYVDYQIAPKTSVGLAGVVGYLNADSGGNQTYQQPLFQLKYRATEKISFTGQAGEEFRQFESNIPNRSQFVFALNGIYDASDSTALTVSSRRETQSSAQYADENIIQTIYQAGVRQRFLQRLYVSVNGGFVSNDYENNRATATVLRHDDYSFGRAAVTGDITARGSLELSYEYRNNDSSVSNFGFTENLVSLGASFLF